jgi:hypothetical protein
MTFFGATAILEFVHIYLKAGYASCMSNPDPKIIQTLYTQKKTQDTYPDLTFEEAKELTASMIKAMMLSATHNSYYIGRHNWRDTKECKEQEALKEVR